jgi:hypothetical protein
MTLGPVLVLNSMVTRIELPYSWLSQYVPGFSSMRVPARFGLMTLPGLAVLAGLGADLVLGRLRGRRGSVSYRRLVAQGTVGVLILAGLVIEFHFAPIPMNRIETGPAVPPVYRWLATQAKDDVVLEVPIQLADDHWRDSVLRARYTVASRVVWK